MLKTINPLLLNLQIFADGTGGESGTGAEGASGETAVVAAPQTRAKKGNSLADVKYGVQENTAQDADAQTNTVDLNSDAVQTVDRNAEFEKLIQGKYKDLYDAKMQDTIQKRLKSTKETVEKYNALSPMFEMLSKKYGVDASDTKAIMKAIEEDDSYYEEEAMEKGISVQQLKEIRKIEKENTELKREMQEKARKEHAVKQYADWMEQANNIRSVYPSFNLENELQNSQFRDLLRSNIDVRTAYEVIHKDEIIPAAMQFTAKTVEKKLTDDIIANGARPSENGMNSQGAAITKSDVSQLSKDDIREIQRRVARGEKISFG